MFLHSLFFAESIKPLEEAPDAILENDLIAMSAPSPSVVAAQASLALVANTPLVDLASPHSEKDGEICFVYIPKGSSRLPLS